MTIDNDSPPGSWRDEMQRMPWKYSQQTKIEEALATLRRSGFALEANLFAQEINVLKAEVEHLRGENK
jgi:hypothetical protein